MSDSNNRFAAIQLARTEATPLVVMVARKRPGQASKMVCYSQCQVRVPEGAVSQGKYACRKPRQLFLNESAATCQSLDWHEPTI